MANHVFNEVEFRGPAGQLMMAADLFQKMEECMPRNEEGQWPPFFIETPKRFFADIDVAHLPGSLKVDYQTDWFPNPEDLVTIAAHFDLSFESSYVEHGNAYYGACRYQEGKFLHAWIEDDDLLLMGYDPGHEHYTFGDKVFKYQGECHNHILKEKLDMLEKSVGYSRSR